MQDLSAIRRVVDDVFHARALDPLLRLLGFPERGARVHDVDADVWHHGLRGALACYVIRDEEQIARRARGLRARNYAELQLYVFVDCDFSQIVLASFGLGEHLLTLTLQRDRIHASDLETLQEMLPSGDERGSALVARYARALDRSRITKRFFSDFAAQRDAVAVAWTGPAAQQRRDREQLALLLLSRLMFLYFLQHRGLLGADRSYLVHRFRQWQPRRSTFYAGVLAPLFFFVLNRRPGKRPSRARSFGDLPYLNGGLFEKHALERKHTRLDLPDSALRSVFDDLLERYRFTASEPSESAIDRVHDVGVDPEMLGRVFEGLMAERVRETTGTFYTPAATVDRLVANTLTAFLEPRLGEGTVGLVDEGRVDALDPYQRRSAARVLRETRILDPACGSGAFLLGGLARVAQSLAALEGGDALGARREVVARSLYGVDVQGDAALLCSLRLWLALVPSGCADDVQPLPNLDRHIRQGDSLIDPIDLRAGAVDAEVRRCIAQLEPASSDYVQSEPEQRPALQRALVTSERRLARAWVSSLKRRIEYRASELRAAAAQKDLFGNLTTEARTARAELVNVRQRSVELNRLARGIAMKDERPFFSFGVHFPEAVMQGFDIVLCNPPWVRSHNWPRSLTSIVQRRFEVCRSQVWRPPHNGELATGGGHQIDLALLFLERAIDLLAPGGALGIVLPAKFMRSLSGAPARRLLLERMEIVSLEDHSLDQRSIFEADAFAALVVARKRADAVAVAKPAAISIVKRGAAPLQYAAQPHELPFIAGDSGAPWLIVPPQVRRAMLRMLDGPMIGAHEKLRVCRGVVTGDNDVMLLDRADAKLSGLALIRSIGHATAATPVNYEGVVEQCAISSVVRGSAVAAWGFERQNFLLCRRPEIPARLPRLEKYLQRHECTIADVPKVPQPRTVVAWHDLASTLKAVVLPPDVVALNTVYFIPADADLAHLLCAYFNSLPVRTFARAIAERAKDAHFRFFAWTVSMLPLPAQWRTFEAARLCELSRCAHEHARHGADQQRLLDDIVSSAYGLSRADVRALNEFDAWLRRT